MGLQRRADRGELVQPSGAPPRLRVTRDASGKLRVDDPAKPARTPPTAALEAAERPAVEADPRSGALRDVPPLGGA